jgi:TIR domain
MDDRADKVKPIFISYRRSDSSSVANHIYDRLNKRFRNKVFMDVFASRSLNVIRERIDFYLQGCSIVLVVIGRKWLNVSKPHGERHNGEQSSRSQRKTRLFVDDDLLRWEVKTALERKVVIVTLLVEGAVFPPDDRLPPDLLMLNKHDQMMIREGPDFERDVEELVKILERNLYGGPRRAFRDFYFRHEHKMTVLGSITAGLIVLTTIFLAMLAIGLITESLGQGRSPFNK